MIGDLVAGLSLWHYVKLSRKFLGCLFVLHVPGIFQNATVKDLKKLWNYLKAKMRKERRQLGSTGQLTGRFSKAVERALENIGNTKIVSRKMTVAPTQLSVPGRSTAREFSSPPILERQTLASTRRNSHSEFSSPPVLERQTATPCHNYSRGDAAGLDGRRSQPIGQLRGKVHSQPSGLSHDTVFRPTRSASALRLIYTDEPTVTSSTPDLNVVPQGSMSPRCDSSHMIPINSSGASAGNTAQAPRRSTTVQLPVLEKSHAFPSLEGTTPSFFEFSFLPEVDMLLQTNSSPLLPPENRSKESRRKHNMRKRTSKVNFNDIHEMLKRDQECYLQRVQLTKDTAEIREQLHLAEMNLARARLEQAKMNLRESKIKLSEATMKLQHAQENMLAYRYA